MSISNKTINKIGIYAVTYDSFFDKPDVIKKYGQAYGMQFFNSSKLLTTSDDKQLGNFFNKLDVTVNYGAGSINQHGIQLYLFDKKARIAHIYNNDIWTSEDVYKQLINLVNE